MAKSTESDKKFAEITFKRYTKAKELFAPVAEKVEINRNLYKGYIQTDDQYEWDYSLVDNQVFPLVRNYIARSNPSMTKIRLEARNPKDFERRQINQDFLNWEIGELPLTQLLTRGFFSNYIAGKAYYKTGWKYEPRVVVKNGKYSYEMRPLINRADLQFVRFNNILIPNRNIPTLKEQPYIFELLHLSPGKMIKDNETFGYEYWDNSYIEKLRKGGVTSKAFDYEATFVEDADTKEEMAFRSATFPVVCMSTAEGERIYVSLNDTDVILNKKRESPYWKDGYDIIEMTAFPEDDEFYSMSVVDAVGDLQIAKTELLNQTLTNVRSLNNNMWITGESQATTPDYMFKQRPSGVIRVAGDPSGVVPVRPNDGTMSMLRMSQELDNKFEKTGGISSLYSSGAPSKGINQTARGAQIIDQNIETNVRMILDLFGEQVLKEIGDQFLGLNAQYVTEEQTFALTGKKGMQEVMSISPDLVSANFNVYTYPEAMIKQTPASRQASLQNLLGTINREVVHSGVAVDLIPLTEALIDSYPEMENVEDIVVSIDEKGMRDIRMLERGQMPEIKVRDAHMELIQIVSVYYEENQATMNPEVGVLFEEYVQKHLRFLQSEKETKAMMNPAPTINPLAGGDGTIPGSEGLDGPPQYNLGQIGGQ